MEAAAANRSDSNNHPKPTAESFNDKAKSVSPDLPCYQTDLLQAFNLHQPPEDSPVRHDRDAGTTLPLAMPRHKNQGSGRGATFPSVLEEPADGVVEASPPDFTMNNLPAELFRGEQPAAAKKKGTSRTSVRRCSLQHIPISQELLDERFYGYVHSADDSPRLDRSLSPPRALRSASTMYYGRARDDPSAIDRIDESAEAPERIATITWNIAAINNNPFEFWVSHHAPEYLLLMEKARSYIEDKDSQNDHEVFNIFTDEMFATLKQDMVDVGMGEGLDELDRMWREHYRGLRVLTQFLKDKNIGSKRLISMPDRIANTVTTSDGTTVMRPSVVSSFEGDMSSMEAWWQSWRSFMFKTEIKLMGADKRKPLATLLKKIPKAKYPAISEEEEAISIPLQILALGIFDAALIYMLNNIAPSTWMSLKRSLSDSLVKNKSSRLADILSNGHRDADVIFVQEASVAFVQLVKATMAESHFVISPSAMDFSRNQNSIILCRTKRFEASSVTEVTSNVLSRLDSTCVAAGDLCVATIHGVMGRRYVLASFHGDGNGFSTMPVIKALHRLMNEDLPDHFLVVGLDANTTSSTSNPVSTVAAFQASLESMGITSCWNSFTAAGAWTSCAARTFLQPQLQKAQPHEKVLEKQNTNLKDWIIFYASQLQLISLTRDNTGQGHFEQKVIPTITFPSDHVLVKAMLSFENEAVERPRHLDEQPFLLPAKEQYLLEEFLSSTASSTASSVLHALPPSPASPFLVAADRRGNSGVSTPNISTGSSAVTPTVRSAAPSRTPSGPPGPGPEFTNVSPN